MYNQAEQQRSTRTAPTGTRGAFTAFGARHVRGVAVTRWVAAFCFVVAATALLATGHWWGVVFVVAAGLNGTLAYLVPHWNPSPDSPRTARISPGLRPVSSNSRRKSNASPR